MSRNTIKLQWHTLLYRVLRLWCEIVGHRWQIEIEESLYKRTNESWCIRCLKYEGKYSEAHNGD